MKILYGVQGTGNGHISRSRAMAEALCAAGAEVDFLFSGRPQERYFDMEDFGDYRALPGLSFAVSNGRIDVWNTLRQARPLRLMRDVMTLRLRDYDLVISDYEPITAWAAWWADKPCLGISHQSAFCHAVPQKSGLLSRLMYRWFAPADLMLGCHWHHFDQPVIPPIAPVDTASVSHEADLIVVYLPFEPLDSLVSLLGAFNDYRFAVYHPDAVATQMANVTLHAPSRDGFHADLLRCGGVICNAGFELPSEALQLGKPLLVKPLIGQFEQESNALALQQLSLARIMQQLCPAQIADWLANRVPVSVCYPDVADVVARWVVRGEFDDMHALVRRLWLQVELAHLSAEQATPQLRELFGLPPALPH